MCVHAAARDMYEMWHTHTHTRARALGDAGSHHVTFCHGAHALAASPIHSDSDTLSPSRACVRACARVSHRILIATGATDRPTGPSHIRPGTHRTPLTQSSCNGGYLQAHHQGVALQLRGESITIGGARGRTAISARARAIYNNIIISHIGVRRSAPLAESPHTTHRTHQNSAKTHLELLERARVASVRPSNRVIIIRTERSARHRFIARCTCACVRAGGQAEHMHRRFCSVRQVSAIALAALEPRHVVCVWYVNCLKYK